MASDGDIVDAYLNVRGAIIREINQGMHDKHFQRAGQWTFNRLYSTFPAVADSLRGTYKDCFFQDDNIKEFWDEADRIFWGLI